MSKITEKERDILKSLGYTPEMIEKLENKPGGEKAKKKKPFKPTIKRMLRISHCLFCNHTKTTFYVLDEISFAAWEGHEVSQEDYLKAEGIQGKPSNYKVYNCDNCPSFIQKMDGEQAKKSLLNLIKPNIGRMPC